MLGFPFCLFVILNFRASSRAKLVFHLVLYLFRIFHATMPRRHAAQRNLRFCFCVPLCTVGQHRMVVESRSTIKSVLFAAQFQRLWARLEIWVPLLHTHLEVLRPLEAIQYTLRLLVVFCHESFVVETIIHSHYS